MRGYASILALGLVLGACSGSEAATTTVASTTTAAPTTTTVVEATTTTTTTTTLPATTTTSAEVDGVPPEALALIGAPMPEVPEYPDGFDAEVWFEAYVAWNQWAFANPEEGLESLDLWVVPGSEIAESLRSQIDRLLIEEWRLVGTDELLVVGYEVADELEDEGFLSINLVTRVEGRSWLLSTVGSVVSEEEFLGDSDSRSQLALEEGEGGIWLLASWR